MSDEIVTKIVNNKIFSYEKYEEFTKSLKLTAIINIYKKYLSMYAI